MTKHLITRRGLLRGGALAASGVALTGCDWFDGLSNPDNRVRNVMESANRLTMAAQRGFLDRDALAREYAPSDIRQPQRPNGVTNPQDADYLAHVGDGFRDYRLEVFGLVDRPLSLSLDEITALPSRTQITRHDCVEGWSCIARWTGVPLSVLLDRVGPKQEARYVLLHCFDTIERSLSGAVKYYETIDLIDARHPQTILAYGLNGDRLPVPNGAPLRMRVERQLGYKMAKYIRAIELIDDFSGIGRGKGGYWEDRGYDWYAGI